MSDHANWPDVEPGRYLCRGCGDPVPSEADLQWHTDNHPACEGGCGMHLCWAQDEHESEPEVSWALVDSLRVEVLALKAERDAAIARAEYVESGQAFEASLLDLGMTSDGFQMTVGTKLAAFIGAHLAEALATHGGENYISFKVDTPSGESVVLTVQKCAGKTPADIAAEARAEVATLKELAESCVSLLDEIEWREETWKTPWDDYDTDYVCPSCGAARYKGHGNDCALRAVVLEAEAALDGEAAR